MKSLILLLLFLLSFSATSAFADTDVESWGLTNPAGFNTASKNLEANYNDDERKQAMVFPLLESLLGCNITKAVHNGPVDMNFFFSGTYKCVGASNQFNTDNWRLFLGPVYLLVKFFSYIFAGLLLRAPLTAIFEQMLKMAEGEDEKNRSKPSDIFGNIMRIIFITIALIPIYKSNPDSDKKDVNLFMLTTYTSVAWALQAGETILNKLSSDSVVEQPYIKIPRADNQITRETLNLVDFFMCTMQQPGTNNTAIEFNRSEGHITAFKQIGRCTLNVMHDIDEGTIISASRNGLPNLYNVEIEALTDAYKNAFTEASNIATKLANHVDLPVDAVAIPFDADMTCEAVKSYELGRSDKVGMKKYVYKAANCMGEEFLTRLTRFPGKPMDVKTSDSDRWVQVCQTTSDMLNLEATQRACAEKMCGSDSSPFVCSAQINNYARLLGNRYMTDPNYITMFGQFVKNKYASSNFSTPGMALANSTQIDSNQSNDIVESSQKGAPAFSVPIVKSHTAQERLWTTAAIMSAFEAEQSMNTDTFGLLNRYFMIGNDGEFGIERTKECLLYPNHKSPSGRVCASIYKELDMLGNRLLAASAELIAGTKAAKIMYVSPTKKAKEKAGLDLALASMQASSKMFGGNSGLVAFLTAATINTQLSNIFSEYGSDFGPEAAYLLALVYTNPDIAEFASSVGFYLWAMGMAIKFAPLITIALVIISFFKTLFISVTGSTIAAVPNFILLLGRNSKAMDPKTDVAKPIESIIVQTVSWALFGAIFWFVIEFIETLFMYKAIPYTAFAKIYSSSSNANSIVQALDDGLTILLYIVMISFIITTLLKYGAQTLAPTIRRNIYGEKSKAPNYELSDQISSKHNG